MARKKIEELYYGYEGKSGILDEVMKDFFENGCGKGYDEKTWLEMLIVKHTLIMAERMKKEGDFVSGITDAEPPSCYSEGKVMKILEELWYGNIRPNDRAFQKNTQIAELTELVTRNEDELTSCLDNDEKDIFHKYQAIQGELEELCECEIFIKGFQLGMQLTVEGIKSNITETE